MCVYSNAKKTGRRTEEIDGAQIMASDFMNYEYDKLGITFWHYQLLITICTHTRRSRLRGALPRAHYSNWRARHLANTELPGSGGQGRRNLNRMISLILWIENANPDQTKFSACAGYSEHAPLLHFTRPHLGSCWFETFLSAMLYLCRIILSLTNALAVHHGDAALILVVDLGSHPLDI